jgi:KipI family sensor histidine kinase inhibitor
VLHLRVCGDDLLSVEVSGQARRAAIAQHLRDTDVWLECVEGMHCIVIQYDSAVMSEVDARQLLSGQLAAVPKRRKQAALIVEIPVCYGGEFGPEFDSICEMMGLSGEQLVTMHTSREHRVDLIGFTPGFAYLSGLKNDLRIPRLTEPRQRLAAGSVGIAAGLTGIYAVPGPGGWPLIGRTPLPLLNVHAAQPFVLSTGMRVRFVAIDAATFSRMASQ